MVASSYGPAAAWRYRLGNRSALEWVLDQYKEKTPKDPTIRAHFDTYRYAAHAAQVVALLGQVARVSVETMAVVDALAAASPLRPDAEPGPPAAARKPARAKKG